MFRRAQFFLAGIFVCLLFTGAGCVQLGFSGKSSGPMGVYASTDKGDTWKQSSAFPTVDGVKKITGAKVFRMFQDPSDPNAIYVATRGQGLFYTYDGGASWRQFTFFSGKFIYSVVIDPKDKCNIYATDGPKAYKTEDCGRTWKEIYNEVSPEQRAVALAIDYGNPQVIYLAKLGGDVLISKNGGKSWDVSKRFGFQLQHLATDPLVPKRVYVAGYRDGLWRSNDLGTTWKDLTEKIEEFNEANMFNRLALNPVQKDSLFWISKYGILRSDDAGDTWAEMKLITPPGSVNIYSFAVNPKNQKEIYYTGTILGEKDAHVRSTFYKTSDGGKSWVTKKMPTNTIPTWILVHPEKNNVLYLGFALLN
jgi:photosystem II stability/assembly factor-like uncharacterized protein